MIGDDETYILRLKSQDLFDDNLVGSRRVKKAEIFLLNGDIWKIDNIIVFLNALKNWERDEATPRLFNIDPIPQNKSVYYSFTYKNDDSYRIFIHVNVLLRTFKVEAATAFLEGVWTKNTSIINSYRGSQGRRNASARPTNINNFRVDIDVSDNSSRALLNGKSMDFYEKEMFSEAFDIFAHTLCNCGFIYDKKSAIENYYTKFYTNKKHKSESSKEKFMKEAQGFMLFRTSDVIPRDKLDIYDNDGNEQAIIDGVYISPYANSILKDNGDLIDGLIMDTTWKIMKNYVTSILVASSFNVSIPLGFSFGPAETKELYELLFSFFKSKLDIDLSVYVIESDQGSALRAVCEDHGNEHLACLRHLLVSLKNDEYGYQVGNLVKCHTDFEWDLLIKDYTIEFSAEKDPKKFEELIRKLHKVGLDFADNAITILDEDRWKQVSQKERKFYRMPSTSNALEAFHGHLNEDVPRRNEFWSSLFRIITSMMKKTFNYKESVHHNYQYTKRKIKAHNARLKNSKTLQSQMVHYETTEEKCQCGDSDLESALFRCNIPCCHRLEIVHEFPDLSDQIELQLTSNTDKITLEIDYRPRNIQVIEKTEHDRTVSAAVKNIRRYSHYKKKNEIKEYVEEHMEDEEIYIFGRSISLFRVISNGIHHFTGMKKTNGTDFSSDDSLSSLSDDVPAS